jgi:periplasmic divalent cation tolerance protein
MSHVILFSTASNEEEAAKISTALVSKHLAAGVNIVPKIRSIYFWKNKVHDEAEVLMMIKSHQKCVEQIKTTLKNLHSYECPELVVVQISDGLKDYLDWIDEGSISF